MKCAIKKLKTSIKTKKPLVEYITVTDINLSLIGNGFAGVSAVSNPEVERNKVK